MATKHYYAMHTPMGNSAIWADKRTIPGTVFMFSKKRERDEWVEDNSYNTYNGNANQTMTITEHEARVTMLRQYGRELYDAHESDRLKGSYSDYREYAQYCPTAIMYDDYNKVVGTRD